jgi:beta-lactamase regulating signal transducer with metallopeptidase domain
VTPPLVGVPLLPPLAERGDAAQNVAAADLATPLLEPSSEPRAQLPRGPVDRPSPASPGGGVFVAAPAAARDGGRVAIFTGLLALSLSGTFVLLGLHAAGAAKACRWLRRAAAENPVLARSVAEIASRLDVRRSVQSCVVEARTSPLLVGWFKPLLIVPRQLLDELSPQQLHGVVAHELAHLVRRDHWANLFVLVVKALLWWNPVVWWADRQVRAAQELCCDAIAIDRCGSDRRSYASTLLKALDFIQTEPAVPRALATAMGSRGTILRRFEMIGETRLSYQVSRSTFPILLALAIPLVCMPVRSQEKGKAPQTTVTLAAGGANDIAKKEPGKPVPVAGTQALDPKIVELGKAVRKRLTTWSDEETLVLKDGQTGRMKIKKNITPVMGILVTPHFVQNGTKFDLEGVDAAGKPIEGTKNSVHPIHDGQTSRMGLGKTLPVGGEQIMAKIQLKPTRQGEDSVRVEVKALFTRLATPEEIEAMLLTSGKDGQLQLSFQAISRWIMEFEQSTGRRPKTLAELNKPLPKDVYSPKGEPIHYEARQDGYVLSSCGPDGVYGNADDQIYWSHGRGTTSGTRHELYPLNADKESPTGAKTQTEQVRHGRPQGKCSIAGKVIDEATGQPVPEARMYLFYIPTYSAVFVNTDKGGDFIFKNIPIGPHSLQSSRTRGYQDAQYNPEGKPGQFPQFSLKEGEHRSGIVLKVKKACRIAGKVLDENGKTPENVGDLTVLAWFQRDDKGYSTEQARVNRSDGSFTIDFLSNKPAYVMAIDWRANKKDHAYPPIYYPSTFSRSQAKLITFDKGPNAENINITLRKEGGLVIAGTVRDEKGKPIPEAFVVAHHRDMLFDFVTAYSDAQGRYELHGLGDGQLLVHVNATHRGFVRTAASVDLDGRTPKTQRDFTLKQGVLISGRFVDKQGNPWEIAQSYGHAYATGEPEQKRHGSFTLTGFDNKYAPPTVRDASGSSFNSGEGPYCTGDMLFPTKSTFVIQGMMPGHTILGFMPQKEGQKLAEIRCDGRDITKSGIDTKPGQELRNVTIVIGAK